MRKRSRVPWTVPLLASTFVLAAKDEVPAEVLKSLDFFMNYDVVKDLDALEPAADSKTTASAPAIKVSTAAAPSKSTDTAKVSP